MRFDSDIELMGIFGFSKWEVIAKNIGMPITLLNGSTFGNLVKNMYDIHTKYKEYSDDIQIDAIAKYSNQSADIAEKALTEFKLMETTGKVNPKNAVSMSTDIFKNVLGLNIKPFLIGGGLALAAYLFTMAKPFIPKKA